MLRKTVIFRREQLTFRIILNKLFYFTNRPSFIHSLTPPSLFGGFSWHPLNYKKSSNYPKLLIITWAATKLIQMEGILFIYNFRVEKGISRKRMWNHLSLVLGPFAVGNFWIFHLPY
jgi:hypothetical protein